MENFLSEVIEWNKFELLIDSNIFNKDIVMKASYSFLDRGYFFFKLDNDGNLILQFTKKEENNEDPKKIIWDFSDELLAVYLRDKLEHDNKDIREAIVTKAIAWPLDVNNFVTLDTDNIVNNQETNQIDFDKDIDDILREIENDPELKIDEEEIERILKEIEEETESMNLVNEKPKITLNTNALKDVKKNFWNKWWNL